MLYKLIFWLMGHTFSSGRSNDAPAAIKVQGDVTRLNLERVKVVNMRLLDAEGNLTDGKFIDTKVFLPAPELVPLKQRLMFDLLVVVVGGIFVLGFQLLLKFAFGVTAS